MHIFYLSLQEANYFANIVNLRGAKADAASRQVRPFGPAISKYRPNGDPEDLTKANEECIARLSRRDNRFVKAFCYATSFNPYSSLAFLILGQENLVWRNSH